MAILFLAAGTALPAAADPLLAQIRAEAESVSPRDFALVRIYTDNSGSTRHREAAFDPRRGENDGWRLLARNHAPPDESFRRRYAERERPPPPSYGRVASFLDGAEAVRTGESLTHAVYRIPRLGPGSVLLEEEDVSAHIAAEIWINTAHRRPYVEEVRLRVAEDFKPHWAVRITEGEGLIRFSRDGEGRPVVLEERFRVRGSRPFGRIDYATASLYRDHEYVGGAVAAPVVAAEE